MYMRYIVHTMLQCGNISKSSFAIASLHHYMHEDYISLCGYEYYRVISYRKVPVYQGETGSAIHRLILQYTGCCAKTRCATIK